MRRLLALASVITALAAALVLVAPSAASAPAAVSIQITKNATLVNPTTLVVPVVAQCPAGTGAFVEVTVSQQQTVGPNTDGFGFVFPVACDGTKQTLNVTVSGGPFVAGQAFASAFNSDGAQFVSDSRVITIS